MAPGLVRVGAPSQSAWDRGVPRTQASPGQTESRSLLPAALRLPSQLGLPSWRLHGGHGRRPVIEAASLFSGPGRAPHQHLGVGCTTSVDPPQGPP